MEHVARMGKGEVNSELWCRNISIEGRRRSYEDDFQMDLKKIG